MDAPQHAPPIGDHMHSPDWAQRAQDDTDRGSAASDTTAFYDARDATSSVATRDDLDQWEDPPEDQHPQQVRNVLACCTLHAYRISASRPAGGVVTLGQQRSPIAAAESGLLRCSGTGRACSATVVHSPAGQIRAIPTCRSPWCSGGLHGHDVFRLGCTPCGSNAHGKGPACYEATASTAEGNL